MKKLNLGSELSKNEQKKVTGGATLLCNASWSQVVYNFPSCSMAATYCAAAQGSTVNYCY
ncbi:hypothetical protein DKG77_05320 [Flagellimonas aquimarina]|jgi:hypothetical protein|uniref:Bacteriocin n=1 Tax=Flagellimonas aquimarina TaxID=2201895 RepID=A0A316L2H3_9FLAO|nr:hypothetical protein [Allomuricauda koreensis]PWL40244.1 hypothetical protein DKG77_05320 [Allomuricauda koreensis]